MISGTGWRSRSAGASNSTSFHNAIVLARIAVYIRFDTHIIAYPDFGTDLDLILKEGFVAIRPSNSQARSDHHSHEPAAARQTAKLKEELDLCRVGLH
jgi:hypothetical protein